MRIQLIVWAILLIFTQSCGTKTKTTNSAELLTFDSEENLYAAIETSEVHCLESECPDYINKPAFWYHSEEGDNYYLGFCSGTLIEEEYVLTNRHCIPEALQKAGASCSRQILIQYPSSDKLEAENVDCKEIVKIYPEGEDQPDMALLKIERSANKRTSTEMKMNEFHSNQRVTSYSMDPSTYDTKKWECSPLFFRFGYDSQLDKEDLALLRLIPTAETNPEFVYCFSCPSRIFRIRNV